MPPSPCRCRRPPPTPPPRGGLMLILAPAYWAYWAPGLLPLRPPAGGCPTPGTSDNSVPHFGFLIFEFLGDFLLIILDFLKHLQGLLKGHSNT